MLATFLIEIPQWGNATLIEILWLSAGVLTLAFCASHLPDLWRDQVAAKFSHRAAIRIAARANLRRELIRIFKGAVISSIGAYAVLEPSLRPGPAVITIVGLLVTAGLLSISFSTALMSWWDWHDRNATLAALDSEASQPPEDNRPG